MPYIPTTKNRIFSVFRGFFFVFIESAESSSSRVLRSRYVVVLINSNGNFASSRGRFLCVSFIFYFNFPSAAIAIAVVRTFSILFHFLSPFFFDSVFGAVRVSVCVCVCLLDVVLIGFLSSLRGTSTNCGRKTSINYSTSLSTSVSLFFFPSSCSFHFELLNSVIYCLVLGSNCSLFSVSFSTINRFNTISHKTTFHTARRGSVVFPHAQRHNGCVRNEMTSFTIHEFRSKTFVRSVGEKRRETEKME